MKFSSSYRWFSNVTSNQANGVFDCLVDLDDTDFNSGHLLVEDQNQLRVYPSKQALNEQSIKKIKIIGKAVRLDIDLLKI